MDDGNKRWGGACFSFFDLQTFCCMETGLSVASCHWGTWGTCPPRRCGDSG